MPSTKVKTNTNPKISSVLAILANKKFFYGVIILLVLQALWIAFTSHYPMAFDEDFHLGIIKIYARHLSPFLSLQPAGADSFGAVARDPSFLYHYLMSFPYRILNFFNLDQSAIILCLRSLNIAMFAAGLVIYRKLLLKLAPAGVVHAVLLFFVCIPVVPFLAAQINYDNAFIGAVGLALLSATNLMTTIGRRKPVPLQSVLILIGTLLFGSIIKYAFLPIAFVIVVFIVICLVRNRKYIEIIRPKLTKVLLLVLAVVGVLVLLFTQRYIVNIIKYRTPIPSCDQVLTVSQCSNYGPWIRDYNFELNKIDKDAHNVIAYSADWFYGMWLRLYFTLDGPSNLYQTRSPLPVPALVGIVVGLGAAVSCLIGGYSLLRTKHRDIIVFLASASVFYVITLFLENYKGFLRTGQPVAINGRYLLPFIPIILVIAVRCAAPFYSRFPRTSLGVAAVLLVGAIYGGGAMTYILRSNDSWYWHNQNVYSANHAVQKVMGPITPGYNQPIQFLR